VIILPTRSERATARSPSLSRILQRTNTMRVARFQSALERLSAAIRDVETEVTAMKAEHDPLASHIFISRRHYRNAKDTKGGKRREINARLSFNTACELGFRGSLGEWVRLRGGRSFASVANGCSTSPSARGMDV
jgi:hypothetical protein